MIAVYLQPEAVQMVRGKIRKDNHLEIQAAEEIKLPPGAKSYFDILLGRKNMSHDEAAGELSLLFTDVQTAMKTRREEIYLVLPDFLFTLVDYFQYATEADIEQSISSLLMGRNIQEVCYSVPIKVNPSPQEHGGTVYAMERDLVDIIVAAAEKAGAKLYSIEAASLSFLRSGRVFRKEEFSLHAFEHQATFIGYSSLAGIFKLDMPELSLSNLSNMDADAANNLLFSSIIAFESTAEQTFTYVNQDVPLILFGGPVLTDHLVLQERSAPPQTFAKYILSDIAESEQQNWMCAVGTLLQSIEFPSSFFPDIEIDDWEKIGSGNVLPEEVQRHTRAYQVLNKIKRGSTLGIAALVSLLVLEVVGMLFMSITSIPEDLQAEYKAAKADSAEYDKELNVIQVAENEHQYPMEAMDSILASKPGDLHFLSLSIGGEGKQADAQWIKLKVAAADPLSFQEYIGSLQRDDRLNGANIAKVDKNAASNMNTAEIVIGKGKVTE